MLSVVQSCAVSSAAPRRTWFGGWEGQRQRRRHHLHGAIKAGGKGAIVIRVLSVAQSRTVSSVALRQTWSGAYSGRRQRRRHHLHGHIHECGCGLWVVGCGLWVVGCFREADVVWRLGGTGDGALPPGMVHGAHGVVHWVPRCGLLGCT